MSRNPMPSGFVDPLGRKWSPEKLQDLLGDYDVRSVVQDVFSDSHNAKRKFCPGRCYTAARGRYSREESAALLFLLVIFHRDYSAPWTRTA